MIKYFECGIRMLIASLHTKPACVQANDLSALPIGWAIASRMRVPLIYDAHELETEINGLRQGSIQQRLMMWLEKKLISKTDATVTVSTNIADWYSKNYGIPKPSVVRNIPFLRNHVPEAVPLKNELGIPVDSLLFLYLGYLCPGRGIRQMIEIFSQAHLDRHILFVGSGDLAPMIRRSSAEHVNIHILPAVPPDRVVNYAAGADIGMCLIETISLSDYYSLPNKLFEYILAGLPVCINDFPDQRAIVESYDCGWVLGCSTENLVSFVNNLTKEMISQKKIGIIKAQKSLSWENEAIIYLKAVKSAIAR